MFGGTGAILLGCAVRPYFRIGTILQGLSLLYSSRSGADERWLVLVLCSEKGASEWYRGYCYVLVCVLPSFGIGSSCDLLWSFVMGSLL